MKQLLILSGKGGTGKTTIASALSNWQTPGHTRTAMSMPPNLHLVNAWSTEPEKADYYGLKKAVIDPDLCVECDQCRQNCRFDAISLADKYEVNAYACEGCGVCEYVCPVGGGRDGTIRGWGAHAAF